jgi:tRNA dimethylallyltransferase
MEKPPVICLMGPTASGKTGVAMRLYDAFPVELISVDSALVYRGMNIGTAKPDADTLRRYPHGLVDIRGPLEPYSAGEFVRDARELMVQITASERIPLLVGGTMMYFRALIDGIADLPDADPGIREAIDDEAAARGWPALHAELAAIDQHAALKINENDSQRIQRALEVYRASGRTLTDWQADTASCNDFDYLSIALVPEPRTELHSRIEMRLDEMLEAGFVDEVRELMKMPGLTPEHASMRAVGYRQYWRHLAGNYGAREARDRALAATRQLAKRQLTWLRGDERPFAVNPLETDAFEAISAHLEDKLGLPKNCQWR